jgi:hypothetical protein
LLPLWILFGFCDEGERDVEDKAARKRSRPKETHLERVLSSIHYDTRGIPFGRSEKY